MTFSDGNYPDPLPENSKQRVDCAVCGQPCIFVPASGDADEAPSKFGGWYCSPCDAFTETDVEVED